MNKLSLILICLIILLTSCITASIEDEFTPTIWRKTFPQDGYVCYVYRDDLECFPIQNIPR
jgi:hypothetical protein